MDYLARAREVVPGVSQTLSKAPSMFVEGAYPVFLERGRGCRVWDVDGNEYVDYVMSLAAVTLGYAHPAIDEAVRRQLERGSLFSLPHPLEVEVSERLTRLIPCAQMVRFLKTGSEGNSAAVRVARAATGRDVIVYCGYSGWHDWYAVTTPRSGGPRSTSAWLQTWPFSARASPTGFRSPRSSGAETSCASSKRSSSPAPSEAIRWRSPRAEPPSRSMAGAPSSLTSGRSASAFKRVSRRSPGGWG